MNNVDGVSLDCQRKLLNGNIRGLARGKIR